MEPSSDPGKTAPNLELKVILSCVVWSDRFSAVSIWESGRIPVFSIARCALGTTRGLAYAVFG